ncbi:WD40/YVTN/BNR-like repeat-containing protein [Eubacterium multiforme]|nr:hypothetical protein [Eubacterium multiforme]
MFKKNMKKLFKTLITNPILIIVYWIFFYEVTSLCMYGRMENNLYIALGCIVFLVVAFMFYIIKIVKNSEFKTFNYPRAWKYISIVLIIFITVFYGIKIYKSATNYRGKLAWYIEDLKNKRSVNFEHNNIYKDGVSGIFEDISKKYPMPKELYISDSFTLDFAPDGTITSFDTFLYGKNDKGKEETYLISYNKNKSKDITLFLNGNVNASYNKDKLLQPLIEIVKSISIKNTVSKWNEPKYGLVYYGIRDFGYNTDGIVNIYKDGHGQALKSTNSQIIGYTVSIFVPGKEDKITPVRYIIRSPKDVTNSNKNQNGDRSNNSEGNQQSKNNNEQFYLSKEIGYRLDITGAALGSRSYSLSKTINGGKNWNIINESPFGSNLGNAAGITFINEKLGFLCLSKSGGSRGILYRTDNGGKTFKEVTYPEHKVEISKDNYMDVFDFPKMPYEKNGTLNMLVGQGSDGDYNGNSKALYESKDKGKTWKYVKEVTS